MFWSRLIFFISSILAAWTSVVGRNPWKILGCAFFFTLFVLFYISGNLGIITDNAGMISRDLHYIKVYDEYKRAFPHQHGTMIIVIDGVTPDIAMDARDRLYKRIRQSNHRFDFIYSPGSDEFFRRNGLLYLHLPELEKLADNLAHSAPLLSSIADHPDLKSLFDLLCKSLGYGVDIDMDRAFAEFATVFQGVGAGRFTPVSWLSIMGSDRGGFVSKRQFIILQPTLDYSRIMPAGELMTYLRDEAVKLELVPENGVVMRLTGEIAMEYEELQSVTKGAELAGIMSFFMVSLVIFAGLGSFRMVIAALVTLVAGLVWTAGFAAVAVGHLNMISVAFAVLFIGLGVDYAIHFCLHFRKFLWDRGNDFNMALSMTASVTGVSLLICAVTTAMGFFAFLPTSFVGVAELGLISGAGMFIGFVATFTMMPALLVLMPGNYRDRTAPFISRFVEALSSFPVRHYRAVLFVTLVCVAVSIFLVQRVGFDDNPLNLRDQSCESVMTFKELLKSDDAPWTLNIIAGSRDQAKRLKSILAGLPDVRDVLTIDSFVPENQDEKMMIIDEIAFLAGDIRLTGGHGVRRSSVETLEAMRRFHVRLKRFVSEKKEQMSGAESLSAAMAYFFNVAEKDKGLIELLERSVFVSLPGRLKGLEESMQASPFTVHDLPVSLREMWVSDDNRIRVEVMPLKDLNVRANLMEFIRSVTAVAPDATGFPVQMTQGGKVVVHSFQEAFALSFICISIFLFLMMPSLKHALLTMLPLVISALFTGAVMEIIGLSLNFANIIGLPLVLGIGVDNGIHMVYHFAVTSRGMGMPVSALISRGIIFSGLTTVCSFGNLAVSPHNGMAGMGLMLTAGVLCTLIVTLFVLPALLVFMGRKGDRV